MPAPTIYLSKDGKAFGPYTQEQIDGMRTSGEIQAYTWICSDPAQGWVAVNAPPPPPPPLPGMTESPSLESKPEAKGFDINPSEEAPTQTFEPSRPEAEEEAEPEPKQEPEPEPEFEPKSEAAPEPEPELAPEMEMDPPAEDSELAGPPDLSIPPALDSPPAMASEPPRRKGNRVSADPEDSVVPAQGWASMVAPAAPEPPPPAKPIQSGQSFLAICHNAQHFVSGTLEKVTSAGAILSNPSPADLHPMFRGGAKVRMNLLDENSGRSENVFARIDGAVKRNGAWEYKIRWDDLPALFRET